MFDDIKKMIQEEIGTINKSIEELKEDHKVINDKLDKLLLIAGSQSKSA